MHGTAWHSMAKFTPRTNPNLSLFTHLCPRELVLLFKHPLQRPVVEAVDVAQAALPREHLSRIPARGVGVGVLGREMRGLLQ